MGINLIIPRMGNNRERMIVRLDVGKGETQWQEQKPHAKVSIDDGNTLLYPSNASIQM